jgi:sarcosine oxidase
VSICPAGVDYVAHVAASLAEIGVDHRLMTGRELRRALPMFATPDDHVAVFEPDAGLLAASRIVEAQIALARDRGADVRENQAVLAIDLDSELPVVVGDGFRVTTERLIVAAGAWVGRLLPEVAATLVPTRQQVLYFRSPDATTFAVGRFPVWIYMGAAEEEAFYGMPDFLGGGAKAARHFGPQTDPDVPDSSVGEAYIEGVRTFLRGQIPALAEAPLAATEACLYTMSPDSLFVVGRWGTREDVFIASPCSGHGFKFSNLVGRALAELASRGSTTVPIGPWAPGRIARVP